LNSAKETLQKGFEELGQEVMKSGAMPGAEAGADPATSEPAEEAEKKKEDDIVDADFEVVDDEKDKS